MDFDEGQLEILLNFALGLCGNLDDAKDLVQEAFLKFLKRENTISNPLAYIKKTMVNLVIDENRKKHRIIPIEHLPECRFLLQNSPKLSVSRDVLLTCPESRGLWRFFFTWFYMEGYSTYEISDMLGIAKGTVKSHFFSGKRKFKKMPGGVNMKCKEVQEKIILFNELSEEEKKKVFEHLKVCESCRRFFNKERRLREVLKSVRVEIKREKLSWRRIAITAAAVMAILLSVLFMAPKSGPCEVIYSQQKGAVIEIFIDGGVK